MWKVIVKLDGRFSMSGMSIFDTLEMARRSAMEEVTRLESKDSTLEGRLVMVIDEIGK